MIGFISIFMILDCVKYKKIDQNFTKFYGIQYDY